MTLNKDLTSVKYAIFDVDGVIIVGCQRASEAAVQKFGLKANMIQTFFNTKWKECVEGRVCLEELLLHELPRWGFSGTTNEYLKFWFDTESHIDNDVLDMALNLRKQGIKCYLGSNQEKFRAQYLWENCKFKEYFDGHFFSGYLRFSKPQVAFYKKIEEMLDAKSDEIVLIDDTIENIQGAENAGWFGLLWPSNKNLLGAIFS